MYTFLQLSERHVSTDMAAVMKFDARMSGVSGNFLVQLATHLSDWSAGGLLRCSELPVCPCVVSFSKFHGPDTHDLLRASLRGCYQKNVPVEFHL